MTSEGNVHTLIIGEVYPEDSGLYACEVYNDMGDDECSCELIVNGECT